MSEPARHMAGYSGTPLAKKLGIKPNARLFVRGAPQNYRALVAPLPEGVVFTTNVGARTNLIHLFVTLQTDLARILASARKKMPSDGTIWVSWPKKTAKMSTDVTEDTIRAAAL